MVKAELTRNDDQSSLQELEDLFTRLDVQESSLESFDQLVYKTRGPRTLIEELCFLGLKQGVSIQQDGKSNQANYLKMAQNIMDTRYALSIEASKLLAAQSTHSRQYFKMIKDLGGFRLFEAKRTEFFLVDSRKDKKAAEEVPAAEAVVASEQQKVASATVGAGGTPQGIKPDMIGNALTEEEIEEFNNASDSSDDGLMGPLMM